ncbi:MAG TPA: hypothetical protein VK555_02115, partial [Terriglobales bacterium]|nr:hypothetical protein [Terriglobales bacterium]
RCFADVSDVVRALLLLVDHPAAIGQVFNVGNPEEVSILELAKLVKTLTGSDSEIRLVPYDQAYQLGFEDMHRRVPNIAKISKLVGFKPSLGLREIVIRIIESRRVQVEEPTVMPITADVHPHSLRVGVGE